MKLNYASPSVYLLNSTRFHAFTQAGTGNLTALESCSFTGGCGDQQTGSATAFFHFCAEGVSDPEYFEGQSFTYLLSGQGCTQIDTEIFNCRVADSNDISCGGSANGFTCDLTDDCTPSEIDCSIQSAGVTVDGEFTNCPIPG